MIKKTIKKLCKPLKKKFKCTKLLFYTICLTILFIQHFKNYVNYFLKSEIYYVNVLCKLSISC